MKDQTKNPLTDVTDLIIMVQAKTRQETIDEVLEVIKNNKKEIKTFKQGDADYSLWLEMEGYNQALSDLTTALTKLKE